MSYNTLVYKISKRYGQALEQIRSDEFPVLSGRITDFLNDAEANDLSDLMGEHVIGYTAQGVRHYIRVYFDEGTYELTGTPMSSGDYGLSSGAYQE